MIISQQLITHFQHLATMIYLIFSGNIFLKSNKLFRSKNLFDSWSKSIQIYQIMCEQIIPIRAYFELGYELKYNFLLKIQQINSSHF